ncbi:hypothetical protein COM40_21385 [Bacillus wiedmannii]|nr:hypothetical protein COM40_21385 [Bacillus wiedmannii]
MIYIFVKNKNAIDIGINSVFLCDSMFYPALMGSKTPTSTFSESKEVRWGINCPLKSDWFN